jgi:hypothetical protein
MRSHFLRQLPITGREAVLEVIPDFDFYALGRVVRLAIAWGSDAGDSGELTLATTYVNSQNATVAEVTLRFHGVRQAILPILAPSLYLSEVEVEDFDSDQLEGVRYRAKDFGASGFEVLANDISIECEAVRRATPRSPDPGP